MNRRNFFSTLATAAAGFTILPPATTYHRIWRPSRKISMMVLNPDWESAPYEMKWMSMSGFWEQFETGIVKQLPIIRLGTQPKTGDLIEVPQFIRSDL